MPSKNSQENNHQSLEDKDSHKQEMESEDNEINENRDKSVNYSNEKEEQQSEIDIPKKPKTPPIFNLYDFIFPGGKLAKLVKLKLNKV